MNAERNSEFIARLPPDDSSLTTKLCELALSTLSADGSAIFLQVGGKVEGPLSTAGVMGATIAELAVSLGEGPIFDVVKHGRTVSASDLHSVAVERWPNFRDGAITIGVHAIHSFPLHLGAVQLGALELYFAQPRHLDSGALTDCYAVADLATSTLLFMQAGLADSQFTDLLANSDSDRLRIHQATGMVAEMLNCSVGDAVARMRAHAFTNNVSLYEVATWLIERQIRLEP